MTWTKACSTSDLDEGEGFQLKRERPIALFNVDDEYFAIDDTCTHDESSLADGYVEGDVVECAWHFAKFCIKTGAVLSLPATCPVSTYAVKVEGDDVFVDLPD
ncbi:3-phenylpropionate/trans-cinnamate dioxygenase ferredoxin subunit [Streptomyces sp. SAI-135]|uniref:bifunctional 3-phenylpropionate/cinnamic acid dioxygenase ferredoxin subunit n=1 Tax=unclassified Streptomyces TaxID=2593676 RepID=UPI002476BE39|nr:MULTISPECIES: bifunctional 3-phenylpropionate/cinnamic acid dioxygenase ferredoxin subunit [unclassified Streptomyces]MDH6522773.1 3-phenylpropionate/trans-cinnamate dioxygenase ferredoxin subunit [Streptomyces sp. SAI-090]MDH6554394.1 3-phenylpropionate/trans-cinnamate dioxygenase ferredoxin subunit [Streptomyces sp. SAI-041]MDH6573660.1 3-phenylpropionate/trans-cinnamate dioxygenase ferredoxin subunit [Streptomyces sp. SAI-117]MDH6581607.1 3-phenylpropionate/trans-cinnamate dioxygenase fer